MTGEELLQQIGSMMDARFDAFETKLEAKMDARFEIFETRIDARFEARGNSPSTTNCSPPLFRWSHRVEDEVIRLSAELQDVRARLAKLERPAA